MAASGSKTLPTIGFLTITEDAETGFVGGLLVLNASGRPLEFHCTAPLKPNRAQEILYGPTLRPFVYGEQIGLTLVSKAKSEPLFLCTDVEPAMCLRQSIQTPMILVSTETRAEPPAGDAGKQRVLRFDVPPAPRSGSTSLAEFTLGVHPAAVLEQHASDQDVVRERYLPYAGRLDLREPFDRIREALDEARRGAAK
jgi:hypothetical protein